ncbi:hypothetical protein WA026_011826 [Henosepilachna vigintioctopunctata]|uniref:Endonuclease/exonuclease/phosphatase domain-containing protein n=1 Tax=Henosepilachna vigintioctopunctata TaxID=420089 RepID=A0AAW1UAB8_9CUCU
MVCIYRPDTVPFSNIDLFFEKFITLLELLTSSKQLYAIVGDFNLDMLDVNDNNVLTFLSILESFNVKITITEPTRITSTTSTLLDNILTNLENGKSKVIQGHISDHLGQFFESTLPREITKNTEKYQFRKYKASSIEDFVESLHKLEWNEIYVLPEDDVDNMWNNFSKTIIKNFEEHFPQKTGFKKIKPTPPITPQVDQIKKQLDILYTVSLINSDYAEQYKITKKAYDKAIWNMRQQYYTKRINEASNKTKETWNIVNNLTNKKRKNKEQLPKTNVKRLVEDFNEFFAKIAPEMCKDLKGNVHLDKIKRNEKSIFLFEVTENELIATVNKLKNGRSFGHDNISMYIIKKSVQAYVKPLCFVINHAFRTGIFPDSLKLSTIKPIFKKGDKDRLDSYRPISILSSFSKIIEKILKFIYINNEKF